MAPQEQGCQPGFRGEANTPSPKPFSQRDRSVLCAARLRHRRRGNWKWDQEPEAAVMLHRRRKYGGKRRLQAVSTAVLPVAIHSTNRVSVDWQTAQQSLPQSAKPTGPRMTALQSGTARSCPSRFGGCECGVDTE